MSTPQDHVTSDCNITISTKKDKFIAPVTIGSEILRRITEVKIRDIVPNSFVEVQVTITGPLLNLEIPLDKVKFETGDENLNKSILSILSLIDDEPLKILSKGGAIGRGTQVHIGGYHIKHISKIILSTLEIDKLFMSAHIQLNLPRDLLESRKITKDDILMKHLDTTNA